MSKNNFYGIKNELIKGASLGVIITSCIIIVLFITGMYFEVKDGLATFFYTIAFLGFILLYTVIWLIFKVLNKLPWFYSLAIFICIPLLFKLKLNRLLIAAIISLSSFIGVLIVLIVKNKIKTFSKTNKVLIISLSLSSLLGCFFLCALYVFKGFQIETVKNASLITASRINNLNLPSPALKGEYKVEHITYGSGNDSNRKEYNQAVTIKTNPVNGSAFLDSWKGFSGWWRKKYWGFDVNKLPLNAHVWYPKGIKSCPLILIVHGDHYMQDYSEEGYKYLAELLASRGMVVVSIDENFLNMPWELNMAKFYDENDARAWLILEHLKLFHNWKKKKNHIFYNKIDSSKIALIGHSKGGEAVSHAALFNKLPYYPDNANIKFDYNYNIKSIVALAPVDGQYTPGDTRTRLQNLNYFTIHGSLDGDVRSFMGTQQYERVEFKDSSYHFKSTLYIHGANHGQFNSTWGNNDSGIPFYGLQNLKQLISPEQQRKITKVYISSFLEVTLNDKNEYLPLFVDARSGKNWLPKNIYFNQFEDTSFKCIANFDEDFDVSTTTNFNGYIKTYNLSLWNEKEIFIKNHKRGSRATFIGWNNPKNEVSTKSKYVINFKDSISSSATEAFVFSMSDYEKSSNLNPLDFTIQIADNNNQKVSFLLSDFSHLQKTIKTAIMKKEFIKQKFSSEMVFQTFYFPMERIIKKNIRFDIERIEKISFIFDKNRIGKVAIDNVGFMKALEKSI